MIAGVFHEGSGLGDQLFRYITVRTLAGQKDFRWGMINHMNFKGREFMNIDTATKGIMEGEWYLLNKEWQEKEVRENGVDVRSFDPEFKFIEDDTIIDGSFEDDKYFRHNLPAIANWLAVEPLNVPDDLCVVGFRGGEYYADSNLGLPKEYYEEAANHFDTRGIRKWQVHTDDPALAKQFFPHMEIVDNQPISHSKHSNMAFNWRSARYAKHAIIPNSAFFILPRILKHHEDPSAITIAPRYWARRNTKVWARPACYYPEFTYI